MRFIDSLFFLSVQRYLASAVSVLVIVGLNTAVSGQITPRAAYNFDALDLSEATGNFQAGMAQANDFYDCGVGAGSNALLFTGTDDIISLDPRLKEVFADDFSLSFYFRAEDTNSNYTLFSIQDDCSRDSSLNIQYTIANEVRITFSADVSEAVQFSYSLDDLYCWNQVVFTKKGTTFSYYINGEFIESTTFLDNISLGKAYPVYVGYSECVGRFDDYYQGWIDELRFYDQALDEDEINAFNLYPDRIISQDTTLFEGDSYQLLTGASCAPAISWSPAMGLDDTQALNPVATPDNTITYQVTFDHGTCLSRDTVRVNIVNSDQIDCNKLLLPKAFSPNGDNLNDNFGISNKFIISSLARFEIYDRWGMKLFETLDKVDEWDGLYKGANMLPGTYVYKIEYDCLDENYQKTGSFNLIK